MYLDNIYIYFFKETLTAAARRQRVFISTVFWKYMCAYWVYSTVWAERAKLLWYHSTILIAVAQCIKSYELQQSLSRGRTLWPPLPNMYYISHIIISYDRGMLWEPFNIYFNHFLLQYITIPYIDFYGQWNRSHSSIWLTVMRTITTAD